jgi:hypothetical protein
MKCKCSNEQELKEPNVEPRIKEGLKKVKELVNDWLTLYKCDYCGLYWEKYYPFSSAQGGGPARIRKITKEYVKEKYGIG